MSILINTKTKKRIYSYTHYTHGGFLKTKQKTNLYITLLPEILMQKIFKQNGIQKENYNLKVENENIPTKPITIKTKITE